MERPSKQGKETEEKLHQQYKHLEKQWDNIKQLKPRTLCRSSTDSIVMVRALHLLDNSPRKLMSSLQHRRSPSDGGGAWKVRYNDLAVEEILRERKAAIESGKLKGRRLFDAAEGASEVGSGERQEIISSGWNGLLQESEVRSLFSYDSDDEKENVESKEEELYPVHCGSSSSSTSSYICDDCIEVAVASEKKEKKAVKIVAGYGTRLTTVKVWLAIFLILCAIGIISMKRLSGNGKVKEVILVPT